MNLSTVPASLSRCAGMLALFLCVSMNVHAQEAKVGFIDTQRILRDSVQAKAAQVKLEREFTGRDKELQEMAARLKSMSAQFDKDAAGLPEADRARRQRELVDLNNAVQRKQREFREDLSQRQQEEYKLVLEQAHKAMKQIAETEKYDIIFENAVQYNARIDITEKVIKALTAIHR